MPGFVTVSAIGSSFINKERGKISDVSARPFSLWPFFAFNMSAAEVLVSFYGSCAFSWQQMRINTFFSHFYLSCVYALNNTHKLLRCYVFACKIYLYVHVVIVSKPVYIEGEK